MKMSRFKTFMPVDAMQLRSEMGALLDRIAYTHERFIIQRRGKPKALLVPVTDQASIEAQANHEKDELDTIYSAIKTLQSVIDDPSGRDASQTIDHVLYSVNNKTDNPELHAT
jgi:antitoxin (DNA-binding transcriptional repressor) of toxin-antitoxin stability system